MPRPQGRPTRPKRTAPKKPKTRFPERRGKAWNGPIVDYKEVELLRKFMTISNKVMSRKRAGTSAAEQRHIRRAIKRARFIALLPYIGP